MQKRKRNENWRLLKMLVQEFEKLQKKFSRMVIERDSLEKLTMDDSIWIGDTLVYKVKNQGMTGWVADGWVYHRALFAINAALNKEEKNNVRMP